MKEATQFIFKSDIQEIDNDWGINYDTENE